MTLDIADFGCGSKLDHESLTTCTSLIVFTYKQVRISDAYLYYSCRQEGSEQS